MGAFTAGIDPFFDATKRWCVFLAKGVRKWRGVLANNCGVCVSVC